MLAVATGTYGMWWCIAFWVCAYFVVCFTGSLIGVAGLAARERFKRRLGCE